MRLNQPLSLVNFGLFFLSFFTMGVSLRAQNIQFTNATTAPYTPTNLISNVFLGSGVEVTSITYQGNSASVGYFSSGSNSVGLDRGIVMTTGLVNSVGMASLGAESNGNTQASVDIPSTATAPELLPLTTSTSLNDIAVYIIKFIPTSDTLRFRYSFASEEYPEYACTDYNDVFGFFIQGPGFPTFTNIALIPNTNLPVAINNLHPQNPVDATCVPLNVQYYNNNITAAKPPVYDGFTDVFTAQAIVTPCQEYTIKLAIADVFDSAWDSGVFLEAKSFGSGSLRVEAQTASNDGTVTEGCTAGALRFQLPTPATDTVVIDYTVFGSATNGIDCQLIPMDLLILPGQTSVEVPIIAQEDGIAEGNEMIYIDVQRDPCNRDTIMIVIRDNGLKAPQLQPDTAYCLGTPTPIVLLGTAPVPTPDPTVFTSNQVITLNNLSTPNTNPASSSLNVFGISPIALSKGMIQSVCVNLTHTFDDDLDLYLISPDGDFLELSTDNGGAGDNYTNACFTETALTLINFPGPQAPASSTPFTGNWLPEGQWSDIYGGKTNGTWKLQVADDSPGFNGTIDSWSITFAPSYRINYAWTPTTGLSCSTCPEPIATPSATTTYQVVATDNYGCQALDSIKITALDNIAATLITCDSVSPNSITFSWDTLSMVTGFEISVNNGPWISPNQGSLSHIVGGLNPLSSVAVSVRGLSNIPCPALEATAVCANCAPPALTVTKNDASCFGDSTGWIVVTPDFANPPYKYQIFGQAVNPDSLFRNLRAGTYQIRVEDQNGCFAISSVTINQPAALVAQATQTTSVSCFGRSDGIATASILSGGTGAANYTWSVAGTPSGAVLSGLSIGNYTVTAVDQNGCRDTSSVIISQPDSLKTQITTISAKCFGSIDGAIDLTVQGGTSGYQYLWSNGSTSPDLANVAGGPYSVIITDARGCTKQVASVVAQPTALVATTTPTAANCFGQASGSATATITGGISGYQYRWSNPSGSTTPTLSNAAAGIYTVTITDQNLCTTTATATINQPNQLNPSESHQDALCFGTATGTAIIGSTGGTGTYQYQWNDPLNQNTAQATQLSAGQYTPIITDANGCTTTISVVISQPASIALNATVNDILCAGQTNGQITLQPSGGVGPFAYQWSFGNTVGPINQNLSAGIYTATLTDANGCSKTTQNTVEEPDSITLVAVPTALLCFQDASGKLLTTASGGTGSLTYQWSVNGTSIAQTANVSQLQAGTYQLLVQDANNCPAYATAVITQPSLLESTTAPISDTICFNATDGQAQLLINGGTQPYQYLWQGVSQTSPIVIGLSAGTYAFEAIDANGCKVQSETLIRQKSEINFYVQASSPSCFNGINGTAVISSVFYGSTPAIVSDFTYQWSGSNQSGVQATGLAALQNYTVTITDQTGCTATSQLTVPNTLPFESALLEKQAVKCFGGNDGTATVTHAGGQSPYSYLWSPSAGSQTNAQAVQLSAGNYNVTIMDNLGCQTSVQVQVEQPSALASTTTSKGILCYGDSNGEAQVIGTGGTSPYGYIWSTNSQNDQITALAAGAYQVTITDANGCTKLDQAQVFGPLQPINATASGRDPICYNGDEGQVIFESPTGGTPPYLYGLAGFGQNGSRVQLGLKAGAYQPFILDANGCKQELPEVLLQDRGPMTVDLGPDITIELGQDTSIFAQVKNALGNVTFVWSAEDSIFLSCSNCDNPSVENLQFQNTFELYIVDSLGCFAEDLLTIFIEKPRRVFVPTGFTPNSDSNNDILTVHGQTGVLLLEFNVYDRWGELLYSEAGSINDQNFGWDGVFRGKEMDPGVYVWTLLVQYTDGVREVLKGNSTLIR
jgi:gliding motility-associated-like protein